MDRVHANDSGFSKHTVSNRIRHYLYLLRVQAHRQARFQVIKHTPAFHCERVAEKGDPDAAHYHARVYVYFYGAIETSTSYAGIIRQPQQHCLLPAVEILRVLELLA
jgi:hypothetical protein